MNIVNILDGLNDKQRDAVIATQNNLLVLAGAGSGKTRVLVHRIAWLQSIEKCLPNSIIAVTFTNKAASEMRHRITELIGSSQSGMWIDTFHGLAHRLLRTHYSDVDLPRDFQIIDAEDQLRLLKRLIKSMNFDEKQYSPYKIRWYINSQKDRGLGPHSMQDVVNTTEKICQKIYQSYQEICDRTGLVDFSELLLRAYTLWINKPHILQFYRERFTNILVDEFQDTNGIQYNWIRLLAGKSSKVMIVGDDDQSIYGWRGAHVENIQRFLKDFSNTRIVRLEQNYRSTSIILRAANTLIENNNKRLGKRLWTNGIDGEPITLYCALNELDEAHFVINCIKDWKNNNGQFKECAILYRKNSQSRVLEEVLLRTNIPYHIYGGTCFFERQEIRDVLAYLRLISNRNDDAAFERVVNVPARGIGIRTLNMVRQISRDHQLTLWQSSCKLLREEILIGRPANSLRSFLELIETLSEKTSEIPLHLKTEQVIKDSGLMMMYSKKNDEKWKIRVENLKELVTATHQFILNDEDQDLTPLQAFLSHATLEMSSKQVSSYQEDAVHLMTLHSSKGLEFRQVFIVGMEEGIFPGQMSLDEESRLEEERRLAYVGVTRAMQKLTLTYSETRLLYGRKVRHHPSRFINEILEKFLNEAHLYNSTNRYPFIYHRTGTLIYKK